MLHNLTNVCHVLFELEVDKDDKILQVNVVVGEHNADVAGDEEDEVKVEKIIKHPAYDDTDAGRNTIAFH